MIRLVFRDLHLLVSVLLTVLMHMIEMSGVLPLARLPDFPWTEKGGPERTRHVAGEDTVTLEIGNMLLDAMCLGNSDYKSSVLSERKDN